MIRDKGKALRTIAVAVTIATNASLAMAQFPVCSSIPAGASKAINRVLVLSPHVTIQFMKFGSQHPSEGTAEQVKGGFQNALSQGFEDQGFKPLLDPILMPEWEAKNALGVNALRDDFKLAYTSCPDCKTLLRSSFANDLEKLADTDEFDGLILAHAEGTVLGSKWMKGSDSLSFDIALISRKSGQIVNFCRSFADGDFVGNPYRSLSGPIQRCLQQWAKPKSH